MGVTLRAENLAKSFRLKGGGRVQALDSVSFSVEAGGLPALVGPDGAGKPTLLRLAAGLLRPDSGSLVFEGRDMAGERDGLQDEIGYMPQKFGLYEDLTVQENLDLYADLKGVGAGEREARYERLLSMSALAPFRDRPAGKLSGGMKQKLGLVCTLGSPPRLLLLDEPTVGVDPLSRRELWDIVAELTSGSGMSVLVSTSYMDEAERCGQVVLLFEGRALARGAPAEIRALSEGMAQLARPSPGDSPRALQARLMDVEGVVDAVPQGGAVRLVRGELDDAGSARLSGLLRGARLQRVPAGLEDSFMLLLRGREGRNEAAPAPDPAPEAEAPAAGEGRGAPSGEAARV